MSAAREADDDRVKHLLITLKIIAFQTSRRSLAPWGWFRTADAACECVHHSALRAIAKAEGK